MSNVASTPEGPTVDSVSVENFNPLELTIELGHARLTLAEVRELRPGAMISLEEYLEDPVTIFAGSRLVGRGEVLLIEGQLGVRITELYRPDLQALTKPSMAT